MSFSGSSFSLNPVISEVSAYGWVLNERMMFFLSRALLCTHKRQFFAEFSHTHNQDISTSPPCQFVSCHLCVQIHPPKIWVQQSFFSWFTRILSKPFLLISSPRSLLYLRCVCQGQLGPTKTKFSKLFSLRQTNSSHVLFFRSSTTINLTWNNLRGHSSVLFSHAYTN